MKRMENLTAKTKTGFVISTAMDKTCIVMIERLIQHPIYKKRVKKRKKLYVHDQDNMLSVGDKVKVIETRPYSKLKRWRVLEIIEKAK